MSSSKENVTIAGNQIVKILWLAAVAVVANVTDVVASTVVFFLAFLSSSSPFLQFFFPSFFFVWRPSLRNHSQMLSTKHVPVSGQITETED